MNNAKHETWNIKKTLKTLYIGEHRLTINYILTSMRISHRMAIQVIE